MDCRRVQEWLLEAENPGTGSAPATIAAHLAICGACRSMADELTHLEVIWRSQPTPPEAETSRLAFLKLLPQRTVLPAAAGRLRFRPMRWALAAAVLLALGIGPWFIIPTSTAQAAPIVERLVDWNLEMTQAETPAERTRLLQAEPELRDAVEKAALSDSDRDLAGHLLENGRWLATNNNPVAEAERFSAVADQLVTQLHRAAVDGDTLQSRRYARLQRLIADAGVTANLDRARGLGALDFEHAHRLEKVILGNNKRMDALVELLQKSPDATRREIKKALDLPRKHPKAKGRTKTPDSAPE